MRTVWAAESQIDLNRTGEAMRDFRVTQPEIAAFFTCLDAHDREVRPGKPEFREIMERGI